MSGMPRRDRATLAAAVAGVGLIVGGEALCILGPLEYEVFIGRVCHAILYSGIALAGVAVVLQSSAGRR